MSVVAMLRRICRGYGTRKCVVTLLCVSGIYLLFTTAFDSFTASKVYNQQYAVSLTPSKKPMQALALSDFRGNVNEGVVLDRHGDHKGHLNEGVVFHLQDVVKGIPHSVSPRVLLLYDKLHVDVAKMIQALLHSHRVNHDLHAAYSSDPVTFDLVTFDPNDRAGVVGRYCLIICAGLYSNLQRYRDYSNRFNITIVSFVSTPTRFKMGAITVVNVAHSNVTGVGLNPSKDFYYLKTGDWLTDFHDNHRWSTFIVNDSADSSIDVWASIRYHGNMYGAVTTPLVLVVGGGRGQGAEVLFGSPMDFWLSKMLLLEVMRSHSSVPILRFGRTRWVMIDIDDIFVAAEGLKMSREDVQVIPSKPYLQSTSPLHSKQGLNPGPCTV